MSERDATHEASEFAREDAQAHEQLQLDARGVHLGRVAADWQHVFGAVRVGRRGYILLARRPPAPPWIEFSERDLASGETLEGIVQAVATRVRNTGYRERGPQVRLSAAQLEELVLAGNELPGALEIPIGRGPGAIGKPMLFGLAGLASAAVGMTLGPAVGLVCFGLGSVPIVWRSSRPRVGSRVLVMTPDGCVVGLPSGPKAFEWSAVASFKEDVIHRGGSPARYLTLTGTDGELIGSIDADWFDGPIELIVAVAEAYRKRRII